MLIQYTKKTTKEVYMDENNNDYVQNNFWKKMMFLKNDIVYYDFYLSHCVRISKVFTVLIAGGTSIVTLLWMEYLNNAIVSKYSPLFILGLQIASVFKDFFPYDSRKNELRDLNDELRPIYEEMEEDWQKMYLQKYTEEDIIQKSKSYALEIEKTKKYYFKDDAIPHNKRLLRKAENEVIQYYKSKGWINDEETKI